MATQPFAGLAPKIKAQYAAALKAGTLLFTESEVVELDDERTGIPVRANSRP